MVSNEIPPGCSRRSACVQIYATARLLQPGGSDWRGCPRRIQHRSRVDELRRGDRIASDYGPGVLCTRVIKPKNS